MLIISVATDLGLLAAIAVVARAGGGVAPASGPSPSVGSAIDDQVTPPPWALCLPGANGEAPSTVAITYLDATLDGAVTEPELRGWFGDLPPDAVQIWRLEPVDGSRRIAFELPSASWPPWRQIAAGRDGRALCDALHQGLTARQIGRPRSTAELTLSDRRTRSRHDLEFIHERRAKQYRGRTWMGTLAELTPASLDEHRAWIAASVTGAP